MKNNVICVLLLLIISNVFAQAPFGIELGMSMNDLNDLFTEPQYFEQFRGTNFEINPSLLKNTSLNVFNNYRRGEGEPRIFFRNGTVIGLYTQSGRIINQELFGRSGTGNLILREWNRYIELFSRRWGQPEIITPTFPIITSNNRVIRDFDALYNDYNIEWEISALFPNGIKCELIIPERHIGYVNIMLTWGERPW